MTYTPFLLCLCALVGILLHHLVKLDSLNRLNNGKINFIEYLKIERFTLMISLIIAFVSSFLLYQDLHFYLDRLGFIKYFSVGYIVLGYFAQSILVKLMGRAQKVIDKKSQPDTDNPF